MKKILVVVVLRLVCPLMMVIFTCITALLSVIAVIFPKWTVNIYTGICIGYLSHLFTGQKLFLQKELNDKLVKRWIATAKYLTAGEYTNRQEKCTQFIDDWRECIDAEGYTPEKAIQFVSQFAYYKYPPVQIIIDLIEEIEEYDPDDYDTLQERYDMIGALAYQVELLQECLNPDLVVEMNMLYLLDSALAGLKINQLSAKNA